MKRKTYIYIIIFLLIAIGIVTIHENYPERIWNKINPNNSLEKSKTYSYLNNPNYQEQLKLHKLYQRDVSIVLLGNSHTYRANWQELLNRSDIANRGIDGDITEGFVNRLSYILQLHPKICFVEGGINDINRNIALDSIISNFNTIIDTLLSHNIKPVITSVFYVSPHFSNAALINTNVKSLNQAFVQLSKNKQVTYLDLNSIFSNQKNKTMEFVGIDGIHITSIAYQIWAHEISQLLNSEHI